MVSSGHYSDRNLRPRVTPISFDAKINERPSFDLFCFLSLRIFYFKLVQWSLDSWGEKGIWRIESVHDESREP